MNRKELIESGLIEEYVLGLASIDERKLVEDMASRDQEIAQLIHEMQSAMNSYCLKRRAGDESKKAILTSMVQRSVQVPGARVKSLPNLSRSRRWKKVGMVALMASALCLSSAGILWWSNMDLKNRLSVLNRDMDDRQREMQRLATEDKMLKERMSFLQHDQTMPIRLTGTSLSPQACATIYWNPQHQQAYLKITHLPIPPEGSTYQLWASTEGEIRNLGTLSLADTTWKKVLFLNMVEKVHVTLEPQGGVEEPSTEKVVMAGQF